MKKILLSFYFFATSVAHGQTPGSEFKDDYSKLGFVSHLAFVKNHSEFFMTSIIVATEGNPDTATVKTYNRIRINVDQLLLQVIADMRRSNTIGIYKMLDDTYKRHGNTKDLKESDATYADLLRKIDLDLQKLYNIFNRPAAPSASRLIPCRSHIFSNRTGYSRIDYDRKY